ncbi:MAG: tRNA uridine-5-carboxymethylaminomethyl(34) synthesis GTPase MnmE [Fusobacteria bacterium]|nr:tRNA uridine-5-carboxymethylaminomethyl(34) synthesis GTPase MnmE [Fusobacteriota bacterium]
MFKTITAISTPRGEGAIGIVRISGSDAFDILKKIFKLKVLTKSVDNLKNFSLNYGYIYDGERLIDEVLVAIMKKPNTFTKENMVEIQCHGGFLVTQKILEVTIKYGAILAEQGEFTKRAFLNGRISLEQAESIMDLIHSTSDRSMSNSISTLQGKLSEKISEIKTQLLDVISHVNVVIDYPEEGIDEPLPENLYQNLGFAKKSIESLLLTYQKGKKIKEGIKTAIIGKPNVGKSSILNALLKEERAIVTHIPGTTRDIIEENIHIHGISLKLIDTAGIRETDDIIEQMGIDKSMIALESADLVLFIVDLSREFETDERALLESLDVSKTIIVMNKSDLKLYLDLKLIQEKYKKVTISAIQENGLEQLEKTIYELILNEKIEAKMDDILIDNIRHKTALEKSLLGIKQVQETISNGFPLDLIAIDLKDAIDGLSEITGEITNEDILDNIFKKFCVGK